MKNLMSFSRKDEVQLNSDMKVIIMKPAEELYLRYAPKLGKMMEAIFGKGSGDSSWAQDAEKYNLVESIVKPILIYCLRNPKDYRKRLLVDSDRNPSVEQEFYDDFNPEIDAKMLKDQGFFYGEDNERILTPKLVLFFGILRKSGWLNIPEEEAEIESFPDEQGGDNETADSGVVSQEPIQQETE